MNRTEDISSPEFVRDLFDRVSETYGYTNYLASFGFTERWRKQCVAALGRLPENAVGVDLMCGRGETWPELLTQHKIRALTGLDISPVMISGAREQAQKMSGRDIGFAEVDVFKNEIPTASADFVISTFGVKTFDIEQIEILAREIRRILKPGGVYSLVEVSDPKGWWLRGLYMFYLKRLMPVIERAFLGCSYGFAMIGTYVERFGDCRALSAALIDEGLDANLTRYFFGCATGICGSKPNNAFLEPG